MLVCYLLIELHVASFQNASITFLYSLNFASLLLMCSCKWSLFFARISSTSLWFSSFFLSILCCFTFLKYFSLIKNNELQIAGSKIWSLNFVSFNVQSAFMMNWKSKKSTDMSCNKNAGFTVNTSKLSPPTWFSVFVIWANK